MNEFLLSVARARNKIVSSGAIDFTENVDRLTKNSEQDPVTGLEKDSDYWMKDSSFNSKANCYFYAVNARSLLSRPDFLSGNQQQSLYEIPGGEAYYYESQNINHFGNRANLLQFTRNVIKGAELEGLYYAGANKPNMRGRKGYLIAMYIRPNSGCCEQSDTMDYHFLRQDSNSAERWSGRWAGNGIHREDSNGKLITNPETAEIFDPNNKHEKRKYVFVGYFVAPYGGLNLHRDRAWFLQNKERLNRLKNQQRNNHDISRLEKYLDAIGR